MTPAKIYPFSIPAGGSFPLMVLGDYCKILTSSGPLSLTGDTFGTLGPILAGQGVEDSPFSRLMLTDNTGAANNGTILIADNKFVDDRITGSVEVIDGGKNRVLENKSFQGVISMSAVPGLISNVALTNPAGSGKLVILKAYRIWTDFADSVVTGFTVGTLSTTGPAIKSKYSTTQNAVALNQYQSDAASMTSTRTDFLRTQSLTTLNVILQEPLVITPGVCFVFSPLAVNNSIVVSLEFNEEAIL